MTMFKEYIDAKLNDNIITEAAYSNTMRVYDHVKSIFDNTDTTPPTTPPTIDAASMSGGGFLFAFDNNDSHIEFQILPNGEVEFFFARRSDNVFFNLDLGFGDLPESLVKIIMDFKDGKI